ncbi:MAG: ArgE/DapE family deacylase [Acidaminococcaceae bacterium]|nr:ArgE/DapE family deacylase [Acidaminococcaceae bacterium]
MNDKILARVEINHDRMVKLVSDMVKIPSVSGNEKNLAVFLNEYCTKLGFSTEIDRHGNFFAFIKGKRAGKRLIFNSHLDTVEVGDGWDSDPFSGKIDGDKLWGRGSTDCKGAIGAQIIAAMSIVEAGLDFSGEICLMYPVEEEVQNVSRKGTYLALKDGFTGDMAINGEDTDLHVCLACEGMLEVLIITHGVGAHGATPQEGKNAIRMMCRVIDELEKIIPGVNKYTGSGAINPGIIQGGHRSSVVPDTCTLKCSRFTVPGETGELFVNQIKEIFARLKADDPAFKAEVEMTYESNPSIVDEKELIVSAIQNAHAIIGKDCPLMGTPQHDDADFLSNVGHIPTVLYGPGTGLLAHMPNEYLKISELDEAAKVYALTIMEALK